MKERDRLAPVFSWLGAMTLLGVAVTMWLMFVHDIRYFGPIPSIILFLAPSTLGAWLPVWRSRREKPGTVVGMGFGTALLVVALLLLIKWN